MNIYERIKKIGAQQNQTIYRIEKECGLSAGSIMKWATSSPKADNIKKVAEFLNVTVDYILDCTELNEQPKHDMPPYSTVNNEIEKITKLFDESGRSAYSILKELQFSPTALNEWKRGKSKPTTDALIKLANYFNVSIDYLLGRTDDPTPIKHSPNEMRLSDFRFIGMKVIGSISAGYDGEAIEEELGETGVPEQALHGYPPEECFILKVKGNSMYPDYHDKDLVLVHRQTSVDSGTIAVIMFNDEEATLKKVIYKTGEDWFELIPRNPEYETKRVEGCDLEECRVLGKVLGIIWRDA